MNDFTLCDDGRCILTIDISIFNENVIAKVLYWLSSEYITYWKKANTNEQIISLEHKHIPVTLETFTSLKEKVNQLLLDFKNRDIINQETKNIRDILYIKAFSNNDEYEDFNLTD